MNEETKDELSPERAQKQFRELIDWMKRIADDKMRTEEGREWLRREWRILVP